MEINQKFVKNALMASLVLWAIPTFAVVYEDAEDNATTGWVHYAGGDDDGASVLNVESNGSRVIQFTGNGLKTGYRLGNRTGRGEPDAWRNLSDRNITWSMNYDGDYRIYVSVLTTAGNQYLTYHSKTGHKGEEQCYNAIRGGKVQCHLENVNDGAWHTITRDLLKDWNEANRTDTIISVNGFFIRGAGMVDNISLH